MKTTNSNLRMEDKIYLANKNCRKLMFDFVKGDWHSFFKTWHNMFPLDCQKTTEYKIMTLKLRVHFAILPIRIVELQQHVNYAFDKSSKVSKIFENVVDKFSLVDYEKDLEDEKSKLTIDSMKQLEDFLSSYNGQKLAKKLRGSTFTTLFALPYIINPHEDESIRNLFSIEWLENLVEDLKNFVENFVKEEESSVFEREQVPKIQCFQSSCSLPGLRNECTSEFVEHESTYQKRKVHSAIKTRDIQNWIAGRQYKNDSDNSCTKSTQTHLSNVKTDTGFSVINESSLHDEELISTKAKLFKVYKHYKKLRLRFHQLHEDYQKMNEIAEELTIALESSVQGQPVNFNTIMQTCLKIFPDRFHKDIQTDSEDTSIDFQDDVSKNIFLTNEKENLVNNILVPPKLLDYEKIKLHLQYESMRTKVLLLQALRQKITLSELEHRNESITEYINNDLLEIWKTTSDKNDESDILPYILEPITSDKDSNLIQQATARLLNTLVSLKSGRNYLTSNPIVLNAIIKYLDSVNNGRSDPITLDMVLATLQKMSLRKQQRNFMVEANLVEWLIHHLNDENFRTSTYRLEYSCALLMNLSLKSRARLRASFIAPLFVSAMITLLSLDYVSILPYVNGALQNFLLNNEVNEEAKKFHLAEILDYHRIKSADETKSHFLHTLRIHKRECEECLSDDDEFSDEDDEIFDVLEKELEENETIGAEADEFQGDQLLALCYTVPAFHLQSKSFFNEKTVKESTVHTLRESKKTESKTSTIIATRETTLNDSKTEMSEKKSGTVVANAIKKVMPWKEDDVFSARPKLIRTPPSSARKEGYRDEILRDTK